MKKVICYLLVLCMCITGMMVMGTISSAKSNWKWPVDGGRVAEGFGAGRGHTGVDIMKSQGSAIYAAKSGKVVFSTYHGAYGNLIVIRHNNGMYTFYSHCSKRLVKAGEKVKRGERIAKVGATGRAYGTHLHFEVRKGGSVGYNDSRVFLLKAVNPLRRVSKA